MRMIEANNVPTFISRVFLTAHQFFGANQESVALCFLFAGVGNRINVVNKLVTIAIEASNQKAAAFKRIIALAVLPDFGQMPFVDFYQLVYQVATAPGSLTAVKACSIS